MRHLKRIIDENKSVLVIIFGMIVVRSAFADWYGVPTSSMYPTLIIGDRIVTNRLAYDVKIPFTDVVVKRLAEPQRGDIVTFTSPEDGIRLVKRLIGIPGDIVEMQGEELIINGVKADYSAATGSVTAHTMPDYAGTQVMLTEQLLGKQRSIILLQERLSLRSFGPVTVPAGQYMMLGDNRDNSKDSRYIGFVKRELLTGRVSRIAFSLDTEKFYLPRLDRFAASLL